jgi:hypothetical protein
MKKEGRVLLREILLMIIVMIWETTVIILMSRTKHSYGFDDPMYYCYGGGKYGDWLLSY